MTTPRIPAAFLANLPAAAGMQLEQAANICRDRQRASVRGSRSDAIWAAKFRRVEAEVERRGLRLVVPAPGGGLCLVSLVEYAEIVNDPRRLEAFSRSAA